MVSNSQDYIFISIVLRKNRLHSRHFNRSVSLASPALRLRSVYYLLPMTICVLAIIQLCVTGKLRVLGTMKFPG